MLLSYYELMELIEQGVIDAKPENVNGASIDITLDPLILLESDAPINVDLATKDNLYLDDFTIHSSFGYKLEPGEFILASSAEIFNLPNNLACEFKLKSSLARCGLQHLLAGWCDPGWTNSKLTLELKNVTEYHTLILRRGMKIGQMVFYRCAEVPTDASYAVKGQYNHQDQVTQSKGVR